MSEAVATSLRARIREVGPITFAEYMDRALYGDGGFYATHPVGRDRGFVTAPHLHPVFGDLVRFAIRDLRDGIGPADPLRLVELGAGDGTLATQVVGGLRDVDGIAVDYTGVDVSAGARADLARAGFASAPRIDDLAPGDPAVVLANELLDNLPVRWLRGTDGGVREVRIGLEGERFVDVEVDAPGDVVALAPRLGAGEEAFVSPAIADLVATVAGWLRRGYVLLIDYGWTDGPAREIHGYRAQREIADVLSDPGSVDITCAADLDLVARTARHGGLGVLGVTTQSEALRALGFADWDASQRERQTDAMGDGRGRDALRMWEGRSLASVLVDPAGMGGFRWMLLGTPGLPTPAWARPAGGPSRAT